MMRAWVVVLVACSSRSAPQAHAPDRALHVDLTTDGDRMHARIVGHDVDLATVPTVSWIGVPMTGSADIAIEVSVPVKDGEGDFRAATGVVSLHSASCSIGFDEARLGRQSIKGIAMPRVPLEKLDLQATIGGGRVSIANWTAALGGADVTIDGHITLAKRLGMSWLAACVRIPMLQVGDLEPSFLPMFGFDGSGAMLKLSGELDEPHALRVPCDDSTVAFAPDDPAASALTGSAPAIDPSPDFDFAAHISSTADNAYTVDRSLFDRLLANPLLATKTARIMPNIKDGQMTGFMLYGIRPGSVFAALGIENGDKILAVNGEAISSADEALELYTKLRDATALHVEVTRRGQPLALDYTIK